MPIQVTCGGCKRNLKVPDSLVGKSVKCPKCAHKIKVSAPAGPVNRLAAAAAPPGKTSLKKAAAKPATGKTSVQSNGKAAAPAAKKPPAKPAAPAKAPTKPTPPAKEAASAIKAPTKLTPAAKQPPPPVKNDALATAVKKSPVAPPRPAPTPPKPAAVPPKKPIAKGKADDDEGFVSKFRWIIGGGVAVIVVCLAWYLFSGPSAGSVSGTVTLGGEPLAGAKVTFVGTEEKMGFYGALTDAQGNYKLVAPTKAGVPLGKYKVIVDRYVTKDGTPLKNMDLEEAKEKKVVTNTVPEIYENAGRTPLEKEVRGGSNSIDLPLEGSLKK